MGSVSTNRVQSAGSQHIAVRSIGAGTQVSFAEAPIMAGKHSCTHALLTDGSVAISSPKLHPLAQSTDTPPPPGAVRGTEYGPTQLEYEMTILWNGEHCSGNWESRRQAQGPFGHSLPIFRCKWGET
jgi:hypothetical protein